MRKSKIKEAINRALKVYYAKGLTSTANAFRNEIFKTVDRELSKNNKQHKIRKKV
jgi:hypothetical protein